MEIQPFLIPVHLKLSNLEFLSQPPPKKNTMSPPTFFVEFRTQAATFVFDTLTITPVPPLLTLPRLTSFIVLKKQSAKHCSTLGRCASADVILTARLRVSLREVCRDNADVKRRKIHGYGSRPCKQQKENFCAYGCFKSPKSCNFHHFSSFPFQISQHLNLKSGKKTLGSQPTSA